MSTPAPAVASDVEMSLEATAPPATPVDPAVTVIADVKHNLVLLERAVSTVEPRFTARVLRTITSLRKRVDGEILSKAVEESYPKDSASKSLLLSFLPSSGSGSMEVDIPAPVVGAAKSSSEVLPEIDTYLRLLVIIWLIDQKSYDKGIQLVNDTVTKVQSSNRRTSDQLAARVYFYYGRLYELTDRLAEIRPTLLAAQRTAAIRHDDDSEATLQNLLLRNYFHYNLYDQADKLVSKTTFPASAANHQLARYLYYLGRIRAVQLNYTEAHSHLQQAIRRAPPAAIAAGFQQNVYKFFIVVELLMGDIPERSIFRQPVLRKALTPYFHIVQAVRIGDLSLFQTHLATHAAQFRSDATYTLILRLRHNVIKTGVRRISLSYARISLADVCVKLSLESEADAEYIVAKAIRDGVIDASIDHEGGWVKSREAGDVYQTDEPQKAFDQRIKYCLQLHNDSVKAMRYPLNSNRGELDSNQEARGRERELANVIAEGGADEDDEDLMDEY
uniref:26S proteasome regulatory subunit RPN3 n=1 Tax=Bartheletia paradoxa TaxID=669517 RepID=A0A2D0XHS5_9BASI|nr:hypothetical protein SPAR04377 [Bartheletia paradoxa]